MHFWTFSTECWHLAYQLWKTYFPWRNLIMWPEKQQIQNTNRTWVGPCRVKWHGVLGGGGGVGGGVSKYPGIQNQTPEIFQDQGNNKGRPTGIWCPMNCASLIRVRTFAIIDSYDLFYSNGLPTTFSLLS